MQSNSTDVRAAYGEVSHTAEEIRGDLHETIPTMSPGDVVRQGDLYVTRLRSKPGHCSPAGTRQLAQGSTRGARHVAEGDCDVLRVSHMDAVEALRRVVPGADRQQFVGPVIRARGPVTITHPEHGDRTLPGNSWYLVTYQRVWDEYQARLQRD